MIYGLSSTSKAYPWPDPDKGFIMGSNPSTDIPWYLCVT